MANMLNFKFGQYGNLPSTKTAGTVYVTTDEQAMYIDLPSSVSSTELTRIRIGDIIVKQSTRDAQPPFAEGAFYYFAEENALLRWSNGEWKQVNSVADVQAAVNAVDTKVDNEITRSTQKDAEHDTAITNLNTAVNARVKTSDFNTFKTSNTAAIADAKKAGTDAAAAASVADGKAEGAQSTADNALSIASAALPKAGGTMTGAINMGSKKITNLATPGNENDAATKGYVDNAKSAVLGSTSDSATVKTVYGAHAAAAAAQATANQGVSDAAAAQSTADNALSLAGEKTTLAEVKAQDYATKAQAQGYVNTLKGASTDSTTAITVYGAINKAAAAQTSANTGITNAAAAQATADNAVTAAADAHAAANVADGKAVAAHNAANAANDNANTRVLTTDFNTFKTSNSETLNALDGRITTAQTTADKGVSDAATAQAQADKGVADAAAALAQANKMLPKALSAVL